MKHIASRFQPLAVTLALMLALVPTALDAQTKVKAGFNMFSPEQDVEIGRQSSSEAERQLPLLASSSVNDYVRDIGQRLAAQAPGPKFRYEFKVVDASDLNAFALPGGFVYVNRGIIENSKNEGELAGVMAHEIAHTALRHGTHNASRAYLTQAGIGILGGILGEKVGGNSAQIINAVGGFGLNVLFLKYSRAAETEADVVGAQILARSGYNPADMANFFDTLAKADKRRTANWLSSHPAPENRRARINKEAALLGVKPETTMATAALGRVQSTLRGLPAARTMEQIATRAPAPQTSEPRDRGTYSRVQVEPPSRELRSFTSRSQLFRIAYPANWEVYEQGATGVTFAPRGGVGQSGDRTEIVYGAIVNHYDPFGASDARSRLSGGSSSRASTSIDDATNDLIAQLSQSSPHLRMVRNSARRFRVPEGTGLGAVLRGNNPNTGLTERVTVVTRQLDDDDLIYLLFVTPEEEAERYSSLLTAMVESMKVDPGHRH